jgi:hypothetical protein
MVMKKARKIFTAEVFLKLTTRVNGYALDVNDEGYMYRNIPDLVNGFFLHVGLGRPNDMTVEDMNQMIAALKDGSAVIQIQREAAALQRELRKQKVINKRLEMKLKRYEW